VLAELSASNSIPVALLGCEAFVGRRREAAELAEVRARGADADGDHVGVGDDRFDCHLEVGELCPEPCDHLPGMRPTLDSGQQTRGGEGAPVEIARRKESLASRVLAAMTPDVLRITTFTPAFTVGTDA
jgi:hypothetical protein